MYFGIPEEAKREVQSLTEALDLFLGQEQEERMMVTRLMSRLGQLHLHGHIPFLMDPTDAVQLLGNMDTSSLP